MVGMEAQGWGVPLGLHQSHQPAGHLPAKAWPGPDQMPFITLGGTAQCTRAGRTSGITWSSCFVLQVRTLRPGEGK